MEFSSMMKSSIGIREPRNGFNDAMLMLASQLVLEMFEAGEFDVCTLFTTSFKSVISQKPTAQQLIPLCQIPFARR